MCLAITYLDIPNYLLNVKGLHFLVLIKMKKRIKFQVRRILHLNIFWVMYWGIIA